MPDLQTGLFFDSIDKHFGGTYALKDVSLSVGRGEIVALLGENGAGKSTLIKVLGGIHTADAGQVLIDGEPYQHKPAGFGERQKVAFIHQDLGLIEWMTVAENIGLALGFSFSGSILGLPPAGDSCGGGVGRPGLSGCCGSGCTGSSTVVGGCAGGVRTSGGLRGACSSSVTGLIGSGC